jgi:hypothetical protein
MVYFIDIWYILWSFGTFCGLLVYFVVIWYIFPRFGIFCREKSGSPASHNKNELERCRSSQNRMVACNDSAEKNGGLCPKVILTHLRAPGLPDGVYFQTKNPDLGKCLRAVQRKMSVYSVAIWSILQLFGIFSGHLVFFWLFGIFSPFWYVVPRKIWQPWRALSKAGWL